MRMHSRYIILGLYIVFSLGMLAVPLYAKAARLFFETSYAEVGVGQQLEISIYVHSEGEIINALSGTIRLPQFLKASAVRDGNSIIALWSRRPDIVGNDITFAGIVPGGWRGTSGLLFSFIVEATSAGSGEIDFSDATVLLHDGKGTTAPLLLEALSLRVTTDIPLIEFVGVVEDREPPEAFTITIERDVALFLGDAFLVFAAQDKGSGIDHYEIIETRKRLRDETKGVWEGAESPYRLQDQSLTSFIYVRAIDRVGNVRVSVHEPEEQKATLLPFIILAFILFLIAGALLLRRKYR